MPLTTEQALRALANRIRSRYSLDYDSSMLLQKDRLAEIKSSENPLVQRFLNVYEGEDLPQVSGHPDYNYLAEPENIGETKLGSISTLFMDLRNFTKYCLFLDKDAVYRAKGAAIAAAADIGRMLGGHLHDIPGDGVILYFGGSEADDLDASTHAIISACLTMKALEGYVIPEFNNEEEYPSIYPKFGLDYGEVLWGAYGAAPTYEVKATGFNVDIASKMMDQLHARQVAIGDDLKKQLEVDEEYIEKLWDYRRTLTISGDERSITYQTWRLNWRSFLRETIDDSDDIALIGAAGELPRVTVSRSRLEDAPLA